MRTQNQPFEQIRPEETSSSREAYLIQANLIKKSNEDELLWVEKNGKAFRQIIESKPEIINLYRENPEAAEKMIEDELMKRQYH